MNTRAEKSFNSAELLRFFLRNFAITKSVFYPPATRKSIGIRRSNEFAEGIKDEADTALRQRPRKRSRGIRKEISRSSLRLERRRGIFDIFDVYRGRE